jgi:putative endonuclease
MQHRDSTGSDFCRRYRLDRLVYAERHATISEAMAREKAIRRGSANGKSA